MVELISLTDSIITDLESQLVPTRPKKSKNMLAVLLLGIALSGGASSAMATTDEVALANSAQDSSSLTLTPMSDAAAQGVGCLALTTPIMAAAYALGPTEIMMLVTGAVIVPSSNAQLFISIGGILGAAACGVGASLTPAAVWAMEKLNPTAKADVVTNVTNSDSTNLKSTHPEPVVSPLSSTAVQSDTQDIAVKNTSELKTPLEQSLGVSEDAMQGTGCLAGVLALSAITLASAPIEIVGLAAGGVAVPTNTSILLLSIVGTMVPAGCSLGEATALPLAAFVQNFSFEAIGKSVASWFDWSSSSNLPSNQINSTVSTSKASDFHNVNLVDAHGSSGI